MFNVMHTIISFDHFRNKSHLVTLYNSSNMQLNQVCQQFFLNISKFIFIGTLILKSRKYVKCSISFFFSSFSSSFCSNLRLWCYVFVRYLVEFSNVAATYSRIILSRNFYCYFSLLNLFRFFFLLCNSIFINF